MRGLMPSWSTGLWRSAERVLAPASESLGMFVFAGIRKREIRSASR
jgi:hypothetical protein